MKLPVSHSTLHRAPQGTPLNPTQINSPASRLSGKSGREARNHVKFAENIIRAKSSRTQMPPASAATQWTQWTQSTPGGTGLVAAMMVVGVVGALAARASASVADNAIRRRTHIPDRAGKSINAYVAPKATAQKIQQSNHPRKANDNRHHEFEQSLNTFSKNKVSRQFQRQPLAYSKRLLPTAAPKETRIAVLPDLPDVNVRGKKNKVRSPLSPARKHSQKLSTGEYLLRYFYDTPIFFPKIAISSSPTNDQHISRENAQSPVPDFDLEHFPALPKIAIHDRTMGDLRIRRSIHIAPFPVNNSTVFSILSLSELPAYQAATVCAIQKISGCEVREAERFLAEHNAELFEKYSHTSSAEEIEHSWSNLTALNKDVEMMMHVIKVSLGDAAFRPFHSIAHKDAVSLGIKDYQYREYEDYAGNGVPSYWRMLSRLVDARMAPGRIKWQGNGHLNILKAVCHQHGMDLPIQELLRDVQAEQFNVLLDQTALVSYNAQQSKLVPLSSLASYALMQARYRLALINDIDDAQKGSQFIPSTPIAPELARYWASGGVIKGAAGQNYKAMAVALFNSLWKPESGIVLELMEHGSGLATMTGDKLDALREHYADVLAMPKGERYGRREGGLTRLFGDDWLTLGELEGIIKTRIEQLMLSTQHPFGSPHHAIETTLLQLGPPHGMDFDPATDLGELLQNLHQLDAAWSDDPRWAVKPSTYAAFVLAETLDIVKVDSLAGNTQAKRIALLVEDRYALFLENDSAAQAWLHTFLPSLEYAADTFSEVVPDVIKPLLGSIIKCYHLYATASETLNYNNQDALLRELNKLFNDAMKGYLPLPAANEDAEIGKLLKTEYGMSNVDIATPITVFYRLTGMPQAKDFISPLAAFKAHSATHIVDMHFKDQSINIDKDRMKIQHRLRASLSKDPVVLARVRQMLRLGGPFTQADFDALLDAQVKTIIGVYPEAQSFIAVMLTDLWDRISSGDPLRIAELFPFVTGVEEIVKGIAAGNADDVLNGIVSLGEDGVLLLAFGVGEFAIKGALRGIAEKITGAALLTVSDSALQIALDEVAISARRIPGRDMVAVHSLTEMGKYLPAKLGPGNLMEKHRVVVHPDPHGVALHPFVDPDSFAVLAARAVDGKEGLTFMTPTNEKLDVTYVPAEKKAVLTKEGIFCLVECTPNGKALPEAPPIYLTHPPSVPIRLDMGANGGSEAITVAEIMDGYTASPLTQYFKEVATTPFVNDVNIDSSEVFDSLFQFRNPYDPSAGPFKENFMDNYENSPTMTAIVNHALYTGDGRIIDIVFNAERARATDDAIYFLKPDELSKLHYMSSTGVEPFQDYRAWPHEQLHKLTGLKDVDRLQKALHRGPTVYMTDRVLFETAQFKKCIPNRSRYEKMFVRELRGEKHMAPEQIKDIAAATNRMIAENLYLDPLIDPVTHPIANIEALEGIVQRRATVLQERRLKELVAHNRHLPMLPLRSRLSTVLDQMIASMTDDNISKIAEEVRGLLMKNRSFNEMYTFKAANDEINPIKIVFAQLTPVDVPLEAYQILRGHATTRILLNSDPVFGYTRHGPRLLSDVQKLVGALVELFQPAELQTIKPVYPIERLLDRQQVVLMTNQIMSGAVKPPLPLICQELTSRGNAIHPWQASVSRMAKDENRVLNTVKLQPSG